MHLLIKAFILITFVGGTGEHLSWFKKTKEELMNIKGIREVYGVFGRWDIITRVESSTIEDLRDLVTDKIRSVPGVQSSETVIVIF